MFSHFQLESMHLTSVVITVMRCAPDPPVDVPPAPAEAPLTPEEAAVAEAEAVAANAARTAEFENEVAVLADKGQAQRAALAEVVGKPPGFQQPDGQVLSNQVIGLDEGEAGVGGGARGRRHPPLLFCHHCDVTIGKHKLHQTVIHLPHYLILPACHWVCRWCGCSRPSQRALPPRARCSLCAASHTHWASGAR